MVRQHKLHYKWPPGVWNDISCNETNGVICQRKVGSLSNPILRNRYSEAVKESDDYSFEAKITLIILVLILVCLYAFIFYSDYNFKGYLKTRSPKPKFSLIVFAERQESESQIPLQNYYI